jgi:helix-turn-helix protein
MSELLTTEDVAARANTSVRKMADLFKAGDGPKRTYIGKRAFVHENDFQQWLLECSERTKVR